jgi:hypothetical protein
VISFVEFKFHLQTICNLTLCVEKKSSTKNNRNGYYIDITLFYIINMNFEFFENQGLMHSMDLCIIHLSESSTSSN